MYKLRKELETRKENLILTLRNNKESLALEKQHQIYGAIKELEHVVRLIEQRREEETMVKPEEMMVEHEKSEQTTVSALKVVEEKVRKLKSPIRIRFAKNDA